MTKDLIYSEDGNITIEKTNFKNIMNFASSGPIYCLRCKNITVYNNSFQNFNVNSQGGVFYAADGQGPFNAKDNNFSFLLFCGENPSLKYSTNNCVIVG